MRRATSRPKMKPPRQPTRHIASKSVVFISSGGPPNRVARICNPHHTRADRLPPAENINHVTLLLSVTGCWDRLASSGHDFINDHLKRVRRPPGYCYLIAFPCEASGRQRRVHDSPRRQLPKRFGSHLSRAFSEQ